MQNTCSNKRQGFIGSNADGVQNSINSYGYNRSAVMYGPFWGSVIQQAYTSAATS